MSRSLIVLLGAGLALLAAFVLLKIPASRSVLTLAGAAFATAVVSLWHAEAVQLLLQPAILGVALAVVATVLEVLLRREPAPAVLTLSSPSDFMGPAPVSSVEQFAGAIVGSDEPTAVRQAMRLPEPVSSSGSRSGR